MRLARALGLPLLLLAAGALPAAAQMTRFEVSPYGGWRWGGEIEARDSFLFDEDVEVDDSETYGIRAEWAVNHNFHVEALWSHQPTQFTLGGDELFGDEHGLGDVDIDSLHLGLLFQGGAGQMHPYGVMSFGISRLDPADQSVNADERFSGSFGGGVKLLMNQHFGFRFEGRWYWIDTVEDDWDDDCCHDDEWGWGQDMFQGEVTVGLIFAM